MEQCQLTRRAFSTTIFFFKVVDPPGFVFTDKIGLESWSHLLKNNTNIAQLNPEIRFFVAKLKEVFLVAERPLAFEALCKKGECGK